MNKSLTIVLPVYNAESRLRKNVRELLELASELTAKFGVLIIDDGSTDATFEVAEELASYFPQVTVRRHRHCRGLGAAIEYVHHRVRTDAVFVHDGVTPINSQQVRRMWRQWLEESQSRRGEWPKKTAIMPQHSIDLADLQSVHSSMEHAHRQVIGFQLVQTAPANSGTLEETAAAPARPRTDPSHSAKHAGVGNIPPLPRPKFLSALAEFALGE